MHYFMWFFFQRAVAALLGIFVYDAFPDCQSLLEIWLRFHAMPALQKVGVVAASLLTLFVVVDTLRHVVAWLNRWWNKNKGSKTKTPVAAPRRRPKSKKKKPVGAPKSPSPKSADKSDAA